MKKLLTFLITFLIFTVSVSASQCTVENGNGKNIGDEIVCGSEHFYVIDNSNDQIKMLSKYNLYIGETFYKTTKNSESECTSFAVEQNGYFRDYNSETHVCMYSKKISESYYNYPEDCSQTTSNGGEIYFRINEIGEDGNIDKCKFIRFTDGSTTKILQNSTAIGAHGSQKGEPEFPEVAVTSYPYHATYFYGTNEYYNNDAFHDNAFHIVGYKNSLASLGYRVEDATFPTLEEIDRVIYSVSNKNIISGDWVIDLNKADVRDGFHNPHLTLDNIKNYVSEKYSWLYSTTYWLSTVYTIPEGGGRPVFFVDTLGYLCTADDCYGVIGAGVRPVVTINHSEINFPYIIETQADKNGSIEVVTGAYADEVITFRVLTKDNYAIKSITVIDASGEKISFTEKDIIHNTDGTISINSFIMPSENVKIIAEFYNTLKNPKTGVYLPLIPMIIIIIAGITYLVWSRKKQISLN